MIMFCKVMGVLKSANMAKLGKVLRDINCSFYA